MRARHAPRRFFTGAEQACAAAIIAAPDGARALAASPAARDFASDAHAHCKFIAYTNGAAARKLVAGLQVNGDGAPDDGFVSLEKHSAREFITLCRQLRFWDRQQAAGRGRAERMWPR